MREVTDHEGLLSPVPAAVRAVLQVAAGALVGNGADKATGQLAVPGAQLLLLVGNVGFDRAATDHFEVVAADGTMATSCETASRSGETVEVVDIAIDAAYDETSRRVLLDSGSRASIAVPLVDDGGATLGVLTAHYEAPGKHDVDMVRAIASDTVKALSLALGLSSADDETDHVQSGDALAGLVEEVFGLRRALETRTVIAQATGLLMGQEALTVEEAFHRLIKVSQASNVKVREIAERYVQTWEEQLRRRRGPG